MRNAPSNQLPIFHPSPLQGLDKPSLGSKSIYSEMTRWLQQSQSNIDHFWKDTALVKALRQYHIASNILEGHTQWKFQKSWILHRVLDVIAVNMESTKRCLDFLRFDTCGSGFPALRSKPPSVEGGGGQGGDTSVLDEDHTHLQ